MKTRQYSSLTLSLCGLILMGIGAYFSFVRPAVLPEDARYSGHGDTADPDCSSRPLPMAGEGFLGDGWLHLHHGLADPLCRADILLLPYWRRRCGDCPRGRHVHRRDDRHEFRAGFGLSVDASRRLPALERGAFPACNR